MPVIISKQQKRQKYLLIVFLGVLLITGVVIWWGFLRKEKPAKSTVVNVPPPREVKINFDLLESQAFKDLEPIKEILPFQGAMGAANPFLSY